MNLTPHKKEIVKMMFDSFIKKCCRNELINIQKSQLRKSKRELLIPSYTDFLINATSDDQDYPDFKVMGQDIKVKNDALLNALEKLELADRELILLLFFIGLKPRDMLRQ